MESSGEVITSGCLEGRNSDPHTAGLGTGRVLYPGQAPGTCPKSLFQT